MTTEIAPRPHTPDVMTLGTVFAKSGYFADARDAAQAVVKMLAGQELGFPPVASMTGIFIVKGRVTISANLQAAAIKRSGKYDYRVRELSDTACKLDFYEKAEKVGESSFSMADAQAAGIANENYRKFARNMLFARAMSNGAKWYCAEVFGGPIYTPDELGATIDMETGELLARPGDERIAPPGIVSAEQAEREAGELFQITPEPELAEQDRLERVALLERVKVRWAQLKVSPALQRKQWEQHVGTPTFLATDGASLDALWALLGTLGVSR